MTISFLKLLIKASLSLYPAWDAKSIIKKILFILRALSNRSIMMDLMGDRKTSLGVTYENRPSLLGVLDWPYVNNKWNLRQRVDAIVGHHKIIDSIDYLNISTDESKILLSLDELVQGFSIVLDRPTWFVREGELCINLFYNGERIYSLAFFFSRLDGKLVAYMGGIQGRDIPNIQEVYHDLTKSLHGCRPRDFLITAFCYLVQPLGCERIYGVADANRHHKHPYFKRDHKSANSSDYDEIWRDRGGEPTGDGFFVMPAIVNFREATEIPPKKRALYRRRYEMLESIKTRIAAVVRQ